MLRNTTSMNRTPNTLQQERFLALFEPHRHSLWRFVRSMVRTHHEAEDVNSDVILHAYQSLDRVRDEKAFASFLFTIAHRVVVRNRWRRRLFADYDEAYALSLPSTELSPDDAADVVLLREALQKLPYRTREAVVMFDVLGFALEDIRVIQGGTISGVKSRLVRGRASLIHLLSAADVNKEQQPHSTTSLATARVQK